MLQLEVRVSDNCKKMSLQSGLLLISSVLVIKASLNNINDNIDWFNSSKYHQSVANFTNLADEGGNFILPKTTVPERYRIHIDARDLYFGSKDYSGTVEIDVVVKKITDRLIIHSRNQIIHGVKVSNKIKMLDIPLQGFSLYPPEDTLIINFVNNVTVSTELVVQVEYSTTMMTYEAGFYQKSYLNNNRISYVGATQFQATEARFAFPHYDEPALKAIFEVKITHDSRHHAISNTFGAEVTK